jgi:tetratricopeptide (TPR) repeat protein
MMPNRFSDTLFQLIKSLEKAEKRHFKLYIKRNSHNQDLKVVELFDALDKLNEYDEIQLFKKLKSIEKPQLANVKVHLYKQLLASLRLLKSTDSIDLQLNEQLDYAHILYKKGLFNQSLKIIEKAKETAKGNHKINYLVQAIALEKRIETLHISRSMQTKAEQLSEEINEVNFRIDTLARLSNLAMLLQSWFIKNGHARNAADEKKIEQYLHQNLPQNAWQQKGFYEKMYLHQSYCLYSFIKQDFLQYYRHAQQWVSIFDEQPSMIRVETGNYIKGLHTLLSANFYLRNYQKFALVLKQFEQFAHTPRVQEHDSFRIQAFVYITSAKVNQHILQGTFAEGISLVPGIVKQMNDDTLFIDEHRILIINYKIASLYFGNEDYGTAIDYLQKIINESTDVRSDLQCYARLLHLITHYELGNYELVEYLTKSVYRFMAKRENLTTVEEEMFSFLRKSFQIPRTEVRAELEKLLVKLKTLEKNRLETRSFTYLDVISWLESKVQRKTLSEVLQTKYSTSKKRKY